MVGSSEHAPKNNKKSLVHPTQRRVTADKFRAALGKLGFSPPVRAETGACAKTGDDVLKEAFAQMDGISERVNYAASYEVSRGQACLRVYVRECLRVYVRECLCVCV